MNRASQGGGNTATGGTVTSSYIKICTEMACQPIPELLTSLGLGAWAAIADACCKAKALAKLALKDCNFMFEDGHAVHTFAKGFGSCNLAQLEVVNCKLGDELVAGLADSPLLGNDKFLKLKLSGCNITCEGANRLARALENVGMMSSLKVLDLSNNRIGDRGACALASMLTSEGASSSVPLSTLELEGNMFTDMAGVALCQAAKGAMLLSRLNISSNQLSDICISALSDAVRLNASTVKEVAVANCKASEDAIINLVKAAASKNTLQLLDIRGVPLGPEGVNQVCLLLRYTVTLTTLRLDVATKEGAEAIARELPNNRGLINLTLNGPVPDGVHARVAEILSQNRLRTQSSSAPVNSSPHIHAWIEDATAGNRRSRSPTPENYAAINRSPRSEAGFSTYSYNTQKTGKSGRSHRTDNTFFSFNYTDITRASVSSFKPLRVSATAAAGGSAEKAAILFRKHDANNDNYLDKNEMVQILNELGKLDGVKTKHIGRILEQEYKRADWDRDGKVNLQDFIRYYDEHTKLQVQQERESRIKSATTMNQQMIPDGAATNPQLKKVYKNYCKFALGQGRTYQDGGVARMNHQQFTRLCQDAGLVEPDGRLPSTSMDVIFSRFRAAGSRRIGFKEFLQCLSAIACESGMVFENIMTILGCDNPEVAQQGRMSDGGQSAMTGYSGAPMSYRSAKDPLPADISFNAMPLSTVAEGRETLARTAGAQQRAASVGSKVRSSATGPATGAKKPVAAARSSAPSRTVSGRGLQASPMYDNEVMTSNFNVRGLNTSNSGNGRRSTNPQAAQDMVQLESRLRMEFEARLSALEERATGSTGMPSLEQAISTLQRKQSDMDSAAHQIQNLHEMLSRLADEVSRLKLQGGMGDSTSMAHQVEELSNVVGKLALDVSSNGSKLEALARELKLQGEQQRQLGALAASSETVTSLEKRLMDRQARFEGALMQVAKQVDLLDSKMREDEERRKASDGMINGSRSFTQR